MIRVRLAFVIGLLGVVMGGGAIAGAQTDRDVVQMVLVLDVSGSMGELVLDDVLPAEIADVRDQIADVESELEAIEEDPTVVAAADAVADAENDPVHVDAREAFAAASEALSEWLVTNGSGLGYVDTVIALQGRLADLGCNRFLAGNLVGAGNLDEVDEWIDRACDTISDADRTSLRGAVDFVEDADFQGHNQAFMDANTALDAAREATGVDVAQDAYIEARNALGFTELNDSLRDLSAEFDDLVDAEGYPTRLELAQGAAQTLLDLSRVDLTAGAVETSIGLVVFSTDVRLLEELTDDLRLIGAEVDRLEPLARTNLGGGLSEALDELEARRDPEIPSLVIVLSDGVSNEGVSRDAIRTDIPRRAGDLDTVVCAAGFGTTEDEVDADLLRALAAETEGEYVFVDDGSELTSFFVGCRQALLSSVVERATGVGDLGGVEAGSIEVPAAACVLSAVVSGVGDGPEVELVGPDGSTAIASVRRGDRVAVFAVDDPAEGVWTATVSGSEDEGFSLVLSVEDCPEASTTTSTATSTTVTTVASAAERVGDGDGGGGLVIVFVVVVAIAVAGLVFVVLRRR